ncbi:MAG: hypothetical protein K2U26_12240, partial [Cyclobacteriaceae bacterium]|nr:hypothetical protein [Cyclobacteriaceae bacterium]
MNRFILYQSFFLVLLSVRMPLHAQISQPYRFEQKIKNSEAGFTVISLKKEGIAFVRDKEKYEQGKKKWHLEILDTTLTSQWSTEMELDNRLVLVGYEYSPQRLYLLFREGETDFYNFQMARVDIPERTYQTEKIKFELNFRITHFTLAGSSAIFGGYISSQPVVLLYDQSSDHPKVLPGLFNNDLELLDVRANQNQSFNVLLAERKGKEKRKLIIRTYDEAGNLLMDDEINFNPGYSIITGMTSALERDELLIVGTYGEGTNRQALGFYSVVVDPFSEQAITFTEFASLN